PRVASAVVISEIMYNPDGSDTDVGASKEWIEVYNPNETPIDLAGWWIEDTQDSQVASAFPNGTVLAAGEALVVTGDAASFDAHWNPRPRSVRRIEVSGFPTLSNSPSPTNELLAIRNADGVVVDEVNYDDAQGWPRDSPDGASIMLRPEALSSTANDVGSAWIPAMPGTYGAIHRFGPGGVQDRASPGFVESVPQAAFEPSNDAAWSMVVLPDTQAYSKSSVDRAVFEQMTQWVVDRHDDFGVQFVLHEGDIVNQNARVEPTSGDQSGDQQWANAKAAMSRLDGVVPYAIAPGNHDYGETNAQDRSTQFNDFFSQSDNPLVDPTRGGTLSSVMVPGELDNALHEFVAPDGREMLVAALEWGPRQLSVEWINRAIRQSGYADHTAILLTHAYMNHDETRLDRTVRLTGGNPHSYPTAPDTHDGEELWNEIVSPNVPFEMVFSGHIGGDGTAYLRSEGGAGQTVHQMLFNTQFETNGGNGWLRVLEFLDDGRTVRVRTYSPLHDLQKTDAENQFEFTISPLRPGDYNGDGVVDAVDYTVWRDAFGTAVAPWSSADGNGDGFIDAADRSVWAKAYGTGMTALSDVVPEPGTTSLVFAVAAMAATSRPMLALGQRR
ncbi:MAG: lamin tail domain-containing protein, partial [Planctomycetota bacterium]